MNMSAEIKLQAGQWYRRRDGEIVYCFAKNPVNVIHPYHLCCEDGTFETCTEDGDFCVEADDDDEDIVEHLPDCTGFDWVPPKPIEPLEGWRLLTEGEAVCVGDMAWDGKGFWDDELLSSEQKIVGQSWNVKYHYPIARKIDPPKPKYRPFKNAEEFRPFRDKWLISVDSDAFSSGFERVISYDNVRVYITIGECTDWWTYEQAMERFTFEDGTPFGVLDDGT